MGGVGAVGLGGIPAPFFSGSGAAALATFAVQLILLSAVVLIGAATIRDLLREVRR